MNNPTEDIRPIIQKLCQGSPDSQAKTLLTYFTPDASFQHPLCAVPSFRELPYPLPSSWNGRSVNSRAVLLAVYRWYSFLSPNTIVTIDSVGELGTQAQATSCFCCASPQCCSLTDLPTPVCVRDSSL
jgi:hypothetical protein